MDGAGRGAYFMPGKGSLSRVTPQLNQHEDHMMHSSQERVAPSRSGLGSIAPRNVKIEEM